jgi:hypothetical protein
MPGREGVKTLAQIEEQDLETLRQLYAELKKEVSE